MANLNRVAKVVFTVLCLYGCISLIVHVSYHKDRTKELHYSQEVLPPRNYLLFVKTHKTGSSTIVNLFQRYAYTQNLTVALPIHDDVFLGWPRLLTNISDVVLSLPTSVTKFNYVINHLVYKEELIRPLFGEEPVRVTIVREPIEQLRSSFNYYTILKEEGDTTTSIVERLELFFSSPTRFDSSYKMDNWFVKSRTKNPQLADLGLSYKKMSSKVSIKQHVSMVMWNFDLLLVTEMMDESLVLLKRLMRWQMQDILYENKYSLPYPGKTEKLSEKLEVAINEWDWGDNYLYWKAKEKLFQLMANEPRFNEELLQFKEINKKVGAYCSNTDNQGELIVEKTLWNSEFIVDRQFCKHFLRKERPFTRLLQVKQRPDIFNKTYYEKVEDSKLL